MRRRLGSVLLAVLVLLGALTMAPSQARDYTYGDYYPWSHYVHLQGQNKLADTGLCVEWHLKGHLRLDVAHYGRNGNLYYRNARFVDPEVSVYTYDRCVSSYTQYRESRRFYGASVTGQVYASSKDTCSWNPSISAGFPWGFSVSVTPRCGDSTRTGKGFQGRFDPNRSVKFVRYLESGRAVQWKDKGRTRAVETGGFTKWLCFDYRAQWKIYRRSGGGSVGMGDKTRWWSDCFNIWEATPYA